MKKVIALMFGLVFMITFVSAIENCYDPDVDSNYPDGINQYEKSLIQYNLKFPIELRGLVMDSCSSNKQQVKEYYCTEFNGIPNYNPTSLYINCLNGCDNGICLAVPDGEYCEENRQCGSNFCVDNTCMDRSLLSRLIDLLMDRFERRLERSDRITR